MYPVRLGYSAAIARINALLGNGHEAEALVTTVFTVEKTLRRTVRQLVVSAGFISEMADKVVRNLRGFEAINSAWEIYDPKHRRLVSLVAANDWKVIREATDMRNKLVHGERVYSTVACRKKAEETLVALGNVKDVLDNEYGYSGWVTGRSRRVSQLHKDPKVRTAP